MSNEILIEKKNFEEEVKKYAFSFKKTSQTLTVLIILNLFWAVLSIYVDIPWLMSVPWYLTPFTPICSLYPLLLAIWYFLSYQKKAIPAWFTTFIFIGCASYGILAQIYFPLYMSWEGRGVNFHDIASMFWVAVYGLQSLILMPKLKEIPTYQLLLIIGYFAFKDFSDYYFKTFVDFTQFDYPEWIRTLMLLLGIMIQTLIILLYFRRRKTTI